MTKECASPNERTENAVILSGAKRSQRIPRWKLKISPRDSSTPLGMTRVKRSSRISMFQRIFIAVFVALACSPFAFSDSHTVTAVLSNSETAVGETVELQIKVIGPGDARPPEEISIDGLEIHATGQSRQFEIHNFTTKSSVTYNYTILPLRAGRFTIPPQIIRAGGQVLRTPELVLNVADTAGQSTTSRPGRTTQRQSTTAGD